MPKIDLSAIVTKTGSSYPAEHVAAMDGRSQVPLSKAGGLTQFGANIVNLAPNGLSSLRHRHENQDEFRVVTAGFCTLVDDHGETQLHPSDCAAFPAGDGNGHHLINKTDQIASFVVVGTHTPTEIAHYSDVEIMAHVDADGYRFSRRDGTLFDKQEG
jgi:uncharacterized cupin superfamily protein